MSEPSLSAASMSGPLFETHFHSLPLIHRGKVRDIYAAGDDHLLIVTTDRLSAFDVVLPRPIPGKGAVLNAVTEFWMRRFADRVPNQLADDQSLQHWLSADELAQCSGRAAIVRRFKALPVECVVRGYLIGSGWKDYCATGAICGIALPAGLEQAAQLAEPLFTPASKAEAGAHDENIRYADVEALIGCELAATLRDISLDLYRRAARHAASCGILIADTKFEFGVDSAGQVHLIDEVLTPDSSRFWPAESWRTGISPPSFDKQIVRDYLETLDWDKRAPGPWLPDDVVERTAASYRRAQQLLTAS